MKIRHCLVSTLALLAACAGSRSRGDWDAPPRDVPQASPAARDGTSAPKERVGIQVDALDAWPESAPSDSAAEAQRSAEPNRDATPVRPDVQSDPVTAIGSGRPPDREVSLHPAAPIPDLLTLLEMQLDANPVDRTADGWRTRVPPPPDVPIETRRNYFWILDTSVGSLNVRLFPKSAPRHVLSLVWLTKLGYYDDLPFHRIVSGSIAQSGDPVGDGSGGPGYRIDGEFPPKGPNFDREGLIGFANAGPNSDGSQFFVTFAPMPHLDGKHTIVGEVVGDTRALRALMALGTKSGRPREAVKIQRAEISIR
ncbi:MAG: peptidylprolyl isomerase [Planctomycetota bacterium]